MTERLTDEELNELRDRAESGYTASSHELMRLLNMIRSLRHEVLYLLPITDTAGFWEDQFRMADAERTALKKEIANQKKAED